jgi:hypothetical protein
MLYHVGFLLSLWRFSDGVSYLVGRVFQLLFYVYGNAQLPPSPGQFLSTTRTLPVPMSMLTLLY